MWNFRPVFRDFPAQNPTPFLGLVLQKVTRLSSKSLYTMYMWVPPRSQDGHVLSWWKFFLQVECLPLLHWLIHFMILPYWTTIIEGLMPEVPIMSNVAAIFNYWHFINADWTASDVYNTQQLLQVLPGFISRCQVQKDHICNSSSESIYQLFSVYDYDIWHI